ncbi:hypothetical protein N7509_011186 [Penicillium cosmopolitanum]|uniref:Zn(2)-C6 fungal-type domain-containing protein n=1 Tax=Penicillium cosmopolitanum TaxID=1131564 RepID=A0A9W9VT36_9EURO|nr:uncharacterized protein N7509_011186 [Penicillium cosmopolitanum]KAJ5388645.1 hypothetical protein N7509_011186 [Penicillium cosmopolitanum]
MSAIKRRACVACTTAKAKCTPKAENLCQRCARLGKACTYLDLPQTKRKRKATPSRVEVLENKVDQLTSQLVALTQQNGQTPSSTLTPLTNDPSSYYDPKLDSREIAALIDAATEPSHGSEPPTSSGLEGQPSIVDRGLLSEVEAEHLLATFRLDLVPKFPFVWIGHDETAARLKNREPFLFLCVVSATMGSPHRLRKIVADEIMKHVTLRIVTRSERNLELLRGLLIHIAWYSYPAEKYHPRFVLLIQICVSMFYDLGLHKKPDLNLDEQRALLGTYWLSAGSYGVLGRPVMIKHDGRIDECMQSLRSTENVSDSWIAPFIHIQSFLTMMDEVHASMQTGGGKALVQVTCGSLQRHFNSVRTRVENDIAGCPSPTVNAIRTEIMYAEIGLHELSLREEMWILEPASTIRTTMLMGMIQKTKELILTIKTIPTSEIGQMVINTCARICAAVGYLSRAALTLLKLITSSNDSDRETQVQAVVEAADYSNLVTELAIVLETRLLGMSAADKETDIVGSLCSKMRLLARCYPYQVREIVGNVPSQAQDDSIKEVDADGVAITPQVWPSIYGDLDDMLPVDDMQWDSLLRSFTGFS